MTFCMTCYTKLRIDEDDIQYERLADVYGYANRMVRSDGCVHLCDPDTIPDDRTLIDVKLFSNNRLYSCSIDMAIDYRETVYFGAFPLDLMLDHTSEHVHRDLIREFMS